MTTLAVLDPGSHRCALVIAQVEAGQPLALLFSHVYPVGRDVPLPEPIVHPSTATRKAWTQTKRHEVTREDESNVAVDILTDCLTYGAEEAVLEAVEYVHGRTPQEVSQTAHAIAIAERILAIVGYAFGARGLPCHHVIRPTWLAALRRHSSATPGLPVIPAKLGKVGKPLDALLHAYLPALALTGADVRDAGGLLVSHVLPLLPPPVFAPIAPAAPRLAKAYKGRVRRRADLATDVLDVVRAQVRAYLQPKLLARRAEQGCTCTPEKKRGRHPRTCPAHPSYAPRSTYGGLKTL